VTGGTVARWRAWEGESLEHLVLHEARDTVTAESVVIGTSDGARFAARYRLVCDGGWRVRRLEVELVGEGRSLTLNADGTGGWRDGLWRAMSELAGAIDVDLSASPFTNTLPIRRLDLVPGQSADLVMAYVRVPELTVAPDPQRYTCLEAGRLYRYDSRDTDFTREIEVDASGLVVTYPGLFRRES
jgi:hypothetical protein